MLLRKIYEAITSRRQYKKDLWFYVDLYSMRPEVEYCMKNQNMSLEEAMMEWDIYPYNKAAMASMVKWEDWSVSLRMRQASRTRCSLSTCLKLLP